MGEQVSVRDAGQRQGGLSACVAVPRLDSGSGEAVTALNRNGHGSTGQATSRRARLEQGPEGK